MKKETQNVIEFRGVYFTPEMLEYLRKLQTNKNQLIDEEIYSIKEAILTINELCANASCLYEDSIHTACYFVAHTKDLEKLRNPLNN